MIIQECDAAGMEIARSTMANDNDDSNSSKKYQKSYFDVLGICCPSEAPLVERILKSMDGVISVSVIVPSKTVIVVHDSHLISQSQISKALNQARLEATVRVYGSVEGGRQGDKRGFRHWPSPYTIVCAVLLVVSLFNPLYRPLKWLAVAAAAAGAPPIILKSFAAARRFTVDINVLMLIAVAGSLALGDYWEAGTIVFLFTIAEWLESRASYKATEVMTSLLSMAPQKAILAESGQVVDARDVKINTIVAVKAGEVVPIDGVVVEGKCEMDESSLTGESFPVAKQPESPVWAGTNNINGYISIRTIALAEDSAVAKMIKLIEEAQNSKSRINRLIDSCAKYYTPAVVLAATAVAVIPVAMRVHNQRHWFHLALVLMVSACPCALVLSTPVASFCALSSAAMNGLLIKGGDYLELLAATKVVAFDKTGTVTRGDFAVIDFRSVKDGICKNSLLYWVSSLESKSSHPMATSLVDYGRANLADAKPDNVSEFQIFPGEGICGDIDGKRVHVGNRRISTRAGCKTVPNPEEETKGVTVGYVFSGTELVGTFSLSDTCRTGAGEAINELKRMGIRTAMLTGDSRGAASYIQNQLGNVMDTVYSELLPEDKVRIINQLKSKEGVTVMVGDGMNDAPAMTAADVGISMGISGSAVAMETSHVTLMSNDIHKIPQAIKLAKRTSWKIIENIILSVSTKAAIIVLAFAGHPLLWAAVLADVGTCLLVIVNSLFLLQSTKKSGKRRCRSSHSPHQHGHDKSSHSSNQHGHKRHHTEEHRPESHCGEKGSYCISVATTDDGCLQETYYGHMEHHEDECCQKMRLVVEESCCRSSGTDDKCCSEDTNCGHTAYHAEECCPEEQFGVEKSCCYSIGTVNSRCSNESLTSKAKEKGTCSGDTCCSKQVCHLEKASASEIQAECCDSCSAEEIQSLKSIHEHAISIGCESVQQKNNALCTSADKVVDVHGNNSCKAEQRNQRCCTDKKTVALGLVSDGQFCYMKESSCASHSSHKHAEVYKRKNGGCCRSYVEECRKKERCCGGIQNLSEIITE